MRTALSGGYAEQMAPMIDPRYAGMTHTGQEPVGMDTVRAFQAMPGQIADWAQNNPLDAGVLAVSPVPVVGDVAGFANDMRHMYQNPEERTWGNAALAGVGLLPFVPPMAGVVRGVKGIDKMADALKKAPADDLVVANRYERGTVMGERGQLHFDVVRDNMGDLLESGFSDAAGNFYSRNDALDYIKQSVPNVKGMDETVSPRYSGLDSKDLNFARTGSELPNMTDALTDLPMDEASRMARAKEMGFDTSRPVFHGTSVDFQEFDPDKSIGTQYWSTTDKNAIEAGEVGAQGKGVIKEMYQRIENPASWDEYDKFGIDELIGRGFDGVALPDGDGQITYIAFKPEQYRDVKAKFDPSKRNSANLLAGIAGGAIVAPSMVEALNSERNQ